MSWLEDLPEDVVEVKVFMRSGDSKLYIVPILENEADNKISI
jgi:hypothetical protein